MPESNPDVAQSDTRTFKFGVRERTYNQIINDLYKPIPERLLRTRRQGGKEITYVAWTDAVKIMEVYAPGWNYEITKIEQFGEYFFVVVKVWLVASDGEFFREASGCEKIDKDGYGDPSSNSESMALRRALVKFGLGIGLYHGEGEGRQGNGQYGNQSGNQSNNQSSNQTATPATNQQPANKSNGGGGKATEKQIKFLSDLCIKKDLSEIVICQEFSGDRVEVFEALSFGEISAAIEAVKGR